MFTAASLRTLYLIYRLRGHRLLCLVNAKGRYRSCAEVSLRIAPLKTLLLTWSASLLLSVFASFLDRTHIFSIYIKPFVRVACDVLSGSNGTTLSCQAQKVRLQTGRQEKSHGINSEFPFQSAARLFHVLAQLIETGCGLIVHGCPLAWHG